MLRNINKEAIKNNRTIDCLLQNHIAKEETKYGFSFEETTALLNSSDLKELQNVRITGLMGMATFTNNEEIIRKEFISLRELLKELKRPETLSRVLGRIKLETLSMGMSNDSKIAINARRTMVILGSLIFRVRP